MQTGIRFVATLLLLGAFAAAACGDDERNVGDSGGTGGADDPGTAGADDAGGMGCVEVDGNPFNVIRPLGNYCEEWYCPASIVDAAERTLETCGVTFEPRITYGCGKVTIDYADFTGGLAFTFDSATDEVVLVRSSNDTPFGECHAWAYYYGELGESCPDAVTCSPCADARNDAGAGGAAGEPSVAGSHCPPFSQLE